MNVLYQEGFIPDGEVDELVKAVKATTVRQSYQPYDIIEPKHVSYPELLQMVDDIVNLLADHYDEDLIEDHAVIFETHVGGFQPLHADAERQNDQGEWEPNHSAWRTHVGLLYLSNEGEDHDGGVLRLPEFGVEYPPQKGLLVGFPSSREYVHEVTKVESGKRYAMAVWTKAAE